MSQLFIYDKRSLKTFRPAGEGETIIDLASSDYNGSAPDMGVHEYIGGSDCTLLGDLNSDNQINVVDVVIAVNIILNDGEIDDCFDLNDDGILNIIDIVILVNIILGN